MNNMISVILPMYNTEEYIAECLDSLKEQKFKDFEVLIVDDGSTDKSCEIVEKYVTEDHRFKLIRQNNGGPSAAKNKGLELSSGTFVFFLDSDDFIDKQTFEILIKEFEKNNVDIITFDARCIIEKNYLYKKDYDDTYIQSMDSFYDRSSLFLNTNEMDVVDFFKLSFCNYKFKGNTVLYMFKRDIIRNNGIRFSEKITYYEDALFLYYNIKYLKKIKYLPFKLYTRRLRENSLMTNEHYKEKVQDLLFSVKAIRTELLNKTVANKDISKMFENYFFRTASVFWHKCDNFNRRELNLDETTQFIFESYERYKNAKDTIEEEYNDNIAKLEEQIKMQFGGKDSVNV